MQQLFLALLASLALLAPAWPARAADPKVNDEANLFKQETIDKANAELKQLKSDTGVEVLIEAFPGIPDNHKAEYEQLKDDPQKRNDFFVRWIRSRAEKAHVVGAYVLIVKEPGHVAVEADKLTRQKALPKGDEDKVRDAFLSRFREKQFDDGLLRGVEAARDAIVRNLNGAKLQQSQPAEPPLTPPDIGSRRSSAPPPTVNPTGGNTGGGGPAMPANRSLFSGACMWIVLIVIGVFVLFSFLRRLGGGRGNYGGGTGYGGGGGANYGPGYGGGGYGGGYAPRQGGGFMSSIFGGLLGGAAGSYIENRMENRHDQGGAVGGGGPTYAGGGTDASSSQGDFGSSSNDANSGAGDWSGGSASQGDFGGGSSDSSSSFDSGGGGGGGDFGGGGDSSSSGGDF